ISNILNGGPVTREESEEFSIWTLTRDGVFALRARTTLGKGNPVIYTPLNTSLARPSQNWNLLKIALITVGALRGSTPRTLIPLIINPSGSAVYVTLSTT